IGSLTPGNPADICVLNRIDGDWVFSDAEGDKVRVTSRLVPRLVFKGGDKIEPDCGLLADVLPPAVRPFGVTRPAGVGAGS
ncbi:MAG TPA: hypothetical protein VL993_10010, partial [Stellaceae bacterium]|nr:hypothetical protein [Stellaceae bacterium]